MLRRELKRSILCIMMALVLVLTGIVPADVAVSRVNAAGVEIVSMAYDEGPDFSASGMGSASFGFRMPRFNNGQNTWEEVVSDLELLVLMDEEWVNIDDGRETYFNWDSTFGVWHDSGAEGYWFVCNQTTHLRFRSKSHPDVTLDFNLMFNNVAANDITSLAVAGSLVKDASRDGTGFLLFPTAYWPGGSYTTGPDDLVVYVKGVNEDDSAYVNIDNNAESGWIYDVNFGLDINGYGYWFTVSEKGSTNVKLCLKNNESVNLVYTITYSEILREDYHIYANGSTVINADTDGACGIVFPYIGGTGTDNLPTHRELGNFVIKIYERWNDSWVDFTDPVDSKWYYQGNGYVEYSANNQWGYFNDYVYGIWLRPVTEDIQIRIYYPLDGQEGGDVGDNYIEYTIHGNPSAPRPTSIVMDDIVVDNDGTAIVEPEGWNYFNGDEFNGNSLDMSKWNYNPGYFIDEHDHTTFGWGNEELEYYTESEDNIFVGDGKLHLVAEKESKDFTALDGVTVTAEYSSGKITSKDKMSFTYGRIDFRAKLPSGTGIWPALWMLPNSDTYGGWASSGEIDVMEARGREPDRTWSTIHFGGAWPGNKNAGDKYIFKDGKTIDDGYHVYSCVWEEDNFKFYVDGKFYLYIPKDAWYSQAAPGSTTAPFDADFYVIMNLAMGGRFDSLRRPDPSLLRTEMLVDYVRIFKPDGTEVTPGTTPSVTSGVTPGVTPGTSPAVTSGVTPGTTPAVTTGVTPGTTPAVTAGVTPGTTPSVTSGVTPGTTPAVTTGVTPGTTPAVTSGVTPGTTPAAGDVEVSHYNYVYTKSTNKTTFTAKNGVSGMLYCMTGSYDAMKQAVISKNALVAAGRRGESLALVPGYPIGNKTYDIPMDEGTYFAYTLTNNDDPTEWYLGHAVELEPSPTVTAGVTPGTTPGVTSGVTPGTTPAVTAGVTPGTTPGVTSGVTPGTTPAVTAGVTPGTTPAVTAGVTPGTTPAVTAGVTPGTTPAVTAGVDSKGWYIENVPDCEYTGKKITPLVVIRDINTGEKLIPNKDYKLSYKNNTNAGTGVIIVRGCGNYKGQKSISFNILPLDIEDAVVTDIYKKATGSSIAVKPVVTLNGKKLTMKKDYVIDTETEESAASYKMVGDYTVRLKGCGNYTGTLDLGFHLYDGKAVVHGNTVVEISKASVSGMKNIKYDGLSESYVQELTLMYKGSVLEEGSDYELKYYNNEQVGTATLVISGLAGDGNSGSVGFTGCKVLTFKILGEALKAKNVRLTGDEPEYNGQAQEIDYEVTNSKGEVLTEGVDYTAVKFTNNVNRGKATLRLTGMGGYTGTVVKNYNVRAHSLAADDITIEVSEECEMCKSGSKAEVTVMFETEKLTENVDYKLAYSRNKAVGEAYVTITGMGNFTGSVKKSFVVGEADISDAATVVVKDVVNKKSTALSAYMAKPAVIDKKDGSSLTAGTDYDKVCSYEISYDNGNSWNALTKDNLDVNRFGDATIFKVEVSGKGNYTGKAVGYYKLIEAPKDIAKATVKVQDKVYTGSAVTISKEDVVSITVKDGKSVKTLGASDYEIVAGSYKKNVNKGTASVIIKGVNEYGGYKTVNFKIVPKDIETGVGFRARLMNLWNKMIK
ncbi:MAG: family 16 glycosylhydrolase [Lachnospiraceae bacterium]|nr:family 16 glycosylhydrolase [Lachnospiraceae bacterium]